MKFTHKAVVAVDLEHWKAGSWNPLKGLDFLQGCELHLVYVFPTTTVYAMSYLGEIPVPHPAPYDRVTVQESVEAALKSFADGAWQEGHKGKLVYKCLFAEDPKAAFCDYVLEQKADLVVTAAREKRGFFESSFSQYVTKHTKANVLVLKPFGGV